MTNETLRTTVKRRVVLGLLGSTLLSAPRGWAGERVSDADRRALETIARNTGFALDLFAQLRAETATCSSRRTAFPTHSP